MMKYSLSTLISASFLAALAILAGACASAPQKNPWAEAKAPSTEKPQSFGSYAAGCIAGATSLPPDGPGFELMRLTRGRFYGNPALIQFIEDLGEKADERHLGPVLIGDLGQARGGPAPTGHRSHQTGLDVDIWLTHPPVAETRLLRLDERESFSAPSVLNADGQSLNPAFWGRTQIALLKLAAGDPRVERIFVNPVIKRQLCASEKDRSWLRKLRPWWGHEEHFHVRLYCPPDDPGCTPQEPLPNGDGCDETLAWWFTDDARKQGLKAEKASAALPKLPAACQEVLTHE